MLSDIELEAMCWKVDAELKKHAANRDTDWWGIYHLWDSPNGDWLVRRTGIRCSKASLSTWLPRTCFGSTTVQRS